MKLAMVIDSERCIGCKACVVSCKTSNAVPAGFFRNWVKEAVPHTPSQSGADTRPSASHFQPGACMHCDKPTCVAACPSGATRRDPKSGEVLINRALCIGCGNCIAACPYAARFKHPVLHVADKCDYCAARREQGLAPACVDTCPTGCRTFGDIEDPETTAANRLHRYSQIIQIENAQTPTEPNMIYVKNTAPTDWTHPAEIPGAMVVLNKVAQPLVKLAVGVVGLGVLAAFVRSLVLPDPPEDDGAHTAPDTQETHDTKGDK